MLYHKKRVCVTLVVIFLFFLVFSHLTKYQRRYHLVITKTPTKNSNISTISFTDHDLPGEIPKDIKYSRKLTKNSPFYYVIDRRMDGFYTINNGRNDENPLLTFSEDKWFEMTKLEQCKILIDSIYSGNNYWSNDEAFKLPRTRGIKELHPLLSTYSERLRIFYHCFLFNDVKVGDVFESDSLRRPLDFQHRMFPFLKHPKPEEVLLPKVTNLTSMERIPFVLRKSVKEYNENFWSDWLQMSHGRGIVTTFCEQDASLFKKLLNVLGHLNNPLPIQIVVDEDELSERTLTEVIKIGRKNHQELVLITYSNLLDRSNRKYLTRYMNKFLASLFNTFEEYIFIDPDIVPFVGLETFFDFNEYMSSGFYISRDRNINKHVRQGCIKAFYQGEPTLEEAKFINTWFKYTQTSMSNHTKTGQYTKMYFIDRFKYVSDSGLVIVNKSNSLPGVISGLMLMFNSHLQSCVNEDNDFFWMGQLFAGLDYEFEPSDAVLIGHPIKHYNDQDNYLNTTLRDDQVSHIHKGGLTWTNGGMTRFKERKDDQGDPKNLHAKLNGYMIPDEKHGFWNQNIDKLEPEYMCTSVEVGSSEEPYGTVSWFKKEEYDHYNTISKIWNDDKTDGIY